MEKLYSQFFNLKHNPFGETPDASFYFDSATHNHALNQLEWAVEQGRGFTLLTGEVGTGKTMVSRIILRQLDPTSDTALVLFPKLGERELLAAICAEFETTACAENATIKDHLDALNQFLLRNAAAGRKSVLIIDEAQNLPLETLETVRLLSNLETEREKLLQIVLLAQPELRAALDSPKLRQLSQRICVNLELTPFGEEETEQYIKHRLEIAGNGNLIRFDPRAIRLIHQRSRGIPRRINKLCERVLLAAQTERLRLIDAKLARKYLVESGEKRSFLSRWLAGEAVRS